MEREKSPKKPDLWGLGFFDFKILILLILY